MYSYPLFRHWRLLHVIPGSMSVKNATMKKSARSAVRSPVYAATVTAPVSAPSATAPAPGKPVQKTIRIRVLNCWTMKKNAPTARAPVPAVTAMASENAGPARAPGRLNPGIFMNGIPEINQKNSNYRHDSFRVNAVEL